MQQMEMQLTTFLRSLGTYKYPTELKTQVMQFVNSYPGFAIGTIAVMRQTGGIVNLICLDGMISTTFQGVVYRTVVKIVLDVDFPTEGGIHLFIVTNLEKSHFRSIKNMDVQNNYYNVEGLPGYTRQLPLHEVIRIVCQEFSKDPPVSAGGRGQVIPRMYVLPSRQAPTFPSSGITAGYNVQGYRPVYSQPINHVNPYEMSSLSSYGASSGPATNPLSQPPSSISAAADNNYYSRGGYANALSAVQAPGDPSKTTICELRNKLLACLSTDYEREKAEILAELESRNLKRRGLEEERERRVAEHQEAKSQAERVLAEKAALIDRREKLKHEIAALSTQTEPDPENLCDPTTEWERQLLNCLAKDNAYEDLIFYLNKAFEKKRLDQEQFLVSVREEAKHQFEQKVLAVKIRSEMKKIGYRPPY